MTKDSSSSINQLLEIMARLRDPQSGCSWDIQQNFSSIAPYTIEEAYEVADAIDRNDMLDLKEELGDLLFQTVFHSRMAEEAGVFSFDDVVKAICEKMVRRHPHVFAGVQVKDLQAQSLAWEESKRCERETKNDQPDASALAGIARGLPEWQRAIKLQKRAAQVGFDWEQVESVFDKLHEEIDELRVEFAKGVAHEALEDEIGDVLFVCANLTRHGKVDFGAALRRANRKFERRFRRMEDFAAEQGIQLSDLSLEQQDGYWNRVKAEERSKTS